MSTISCSNCPECGAQGDLQEEYEVYFNRKGIFMVDYKGECPMCGWEFEYTYEEEM